MMKIKCLTVFAFLFSILQVNGQEKDFNSRELSITQWVDGTLLTPKQTEKPKLAIIIAGSGPTNRNGNQNFQKNNSLKKLAERLTQNGIATFRYDKRIIKQILRGTLDNNTMFDDFVADARTVLAYFKDLHSFSEIYLIGHSQGSLVGMLAATDQADGFISLAGAGQNIGDVIVEQATKMDPNLGKATQPVIDKLKKGKKVSDFPPAMASVFSPDMQDFMINWMSYNPSELIKDLSIPILLVNGTKDLQVSVAEAELLKAANEKATLKIIENMNHVLFEIEGDDLENAKSYNESFRAISPELIASITDFIKA